MLEAYRKHVEERAAQGVVPQPLNAEQTAGLIELLKNPPAGEEEFLLDLITNRVPAGVDEAAYVKAGFLSAIAKGEATSPLISKQRAVELLGTMQGGYNIATLVELLDSPELANATAEQLKHTLLMFDAFHDVAERAKKGNAAAQAVLKSWAEGEWFQNRPALAEKITLSVFKVTGETNTDDLSPAPDAWSRPDIPLHALAMLKMARDGINPDVPGSVGPIKQMEALKAKGFPVAYVGDVVGTGSSRKSATNSVLWFFGDDIPYVPNKRAGGFCFGTKIAPIFYNTMEDAGALPIEFDCTNLAMGDVIDVYPYKGEVRRHDSNELVTTFQLKTDVLLDEVRAGGRIPLIIGRGLTEKARAELGLAPSTLFKKPEAPADSGKGFTLAQKMVGRACGMDGVLPGMVCDPKMATVASQDTTGPMTMQEIAELACLRFKADLFMQSFCHTAAYPKASDLGRWQTMTETTISCGGVALKPGDGVVHSWVNRMLLPDTVGTGGDSHTRFPLGISFPAGSGLVAFAGALGFMPLEMPESVLVRFSGKRRPGITVRDMVNAIPWFAIGEGLLTVAKKGKKNVFAGTVLEIEGVDDLSVEEAFELSDASAERSAAACALQLSLPAVVANVEANVALLKQLIREGYADRSALERRVEAMERWLASPSLLRADDKARYKAVLEIDLAAISEPLLACPNDPDDVRPLSEVAGAVIDEAFIGSCMTHLSHLRNAARLLRGEPYAVSRLWIAPATRMDRDAIQREGGLSVFAQVGGRVEIPGCSLCMGNQARVRPGATVMSTSTRNFDNRLGDGARVYLGSTELTALAALQGRLPTPAEYFQFLERKGVMG